MADVLDFTPPVVNVVGYAGDTLSITILTTPPTYTDGALWSAQVRSSTASGEVLEFFSIAAVPGGACLTLTAEQTTRLAELGVVKRARGCDVYQMFQGVWDAQVLWTVDGRVQTLVRGGLGMAMDVTRDAALVAVGQAGTDEAPASASVETTVNVDTTNSAIIYVEVIGGCGSGGGGGTGAEEVWVGTEEPTDSAMELWVDTDADPETEPLGAQVLSQRKPRRRYQRPAPQQRASIPASMDHVAALLVRIEALEQRIRELGG